MIDNAREVFGIDDLNKVAFNGAAAGRGGELNASVITHWASMDPSLYRRDQRFYRRYESNWANPDKE